MTFEDGKKLSILKSDVVKCFASAFDIAYHKDEEELIRLFSDHSVDKDIIEMRVRRLNALYHTRLRNGQITSLTEYLSSQGSDFEKRILTSATDVVNQIAQCGGKNWFVFATKYCSFVNSEKYPIYDSLVVKALEY